MKTYLLSIKERISSRDLLWTWGCSLAYLILSSIFIGFKTDQLVLVFLFNGLYYLSAPTRRFILGFSIFIVFWIIFDSMKAFPNYQFNPIHTEQLYRAEQTWFGIHEQGKRYTPNEYADRHATTFLDVMTGLFYINWVPIPLVFAFFLFRTRKQAFLQFSLAFLFVNLLGFVVYYLYPAAPPWYIKQYGFEVFFNTPGNTAGLSRFDEFFGIKLFAGLYAKSSNVFAAMPSLHSAYPVVVLYYGLKNRLGWINVFFALFMIGIWFSAVYSGHHYVMDVMAGATTAVLGLLVFDKVIVRRTFFRRFEQGYLRAISPV